MPEVVEPPQYSLPAGARLRKLLLAFTHGLASSDTSTFTGQSSRRRAGRRVSDACFGRRGPRPLRAAIARLLTKELDIATSAIIAQQVVHLTLGDAYQELVLGTGSPRADVFESQIDAALALVGLTA